MNRLHELLSIALDVFDLATSKGFYFLPFLFAIAYLILSEDEKHKRTITFLLAPTALGLLILLSPFVGSYAEGRDYIQICRFYWILPFDLIVAYCIADSLWNAKRPAAKAALIAVLALGIMSSTRQYNTIYPRHRKKSCADRSNRPTRKPILSWDSSCGNPFSCSQVV